MGVVELLIKAWPISARTDHHADHRAWRSWTLRVAVLGRENQNLV
jgi:hypothetical protein